MEEEAARYARLSELIRWSRGAAGLSVTDAADLAGLSRSRWTVFEQQGVPSTARPQTLRAIERALSWPPGSIRRFLETGEEPPLFAQSVLDVSMPDDREQLLVALRRELTGSERREMRKLLLRLLADTEGDVD